MPSDVATHLALQVVFDELHPEGLRGFCRDLRQQHKGWDYTARQVEALCGLSAEGRTYQRMFAGEDWAEAPVRWWLNPDRPKRGGK